jgi:hypothetical protein
MVKHPIDFTFYLFKVNLDNSQSLDVLHRLFECLAPIVFRPVDILLKTLLQAPTNIVSYDLYHWTSLSLLYFLCTYNILWIRFNDRMPPIYIWCSNIKSALDEYFDKILSLISKIQQKKLPSQLTCHWFHFILCKKLKPMSLNLSRFIIA